MTGFYTHFTFLININYGGSERYRRHVELAVLLSLLLPPIPPYRILISLSLSLSLSITLLSPGDAFVASAEKELKRWFTTGAQKNENAAEFYKKAANQFKSAKLLVKAATAFDKAAQCYTKADSQHDSAGMFQEAAKVLKASGDAEGSQM